MKKINFNIITPFYLPHIGGLEFYTYYFSKELTKYGCTVNIITTNSDNKRFYKKEKKINVFRLSSLFLVGKRFPLPYSFREMFKIYKECFSPYRNSITIVHTRFFLTSILGAFMARLADSRIILIEHGSGHFNYDNEFVTVLSKIYEHVVTLFLKILKIEYFGVSKASIRWLKHFNISAKGLISNGVEISSSVKIQRRKKKKIITYAGRLVKTKGIETILQAFKLFNLDFPDYQLIIAGSGELEQLVKKEAVINKSVLYLGELSHQKVMNLFSQSSYFLYPSQYPEGLPTAVLEAGAFAIPVITTLQGGLQDLIQDGKNGYVLHYNTVEELNMKLKQAVTHESQSSLIGRNLQKTILKNHNWTHIVFNFLKTI